MAADAVGRGHILDREHRSLTAGVILSITAVAFEGLAVTTIAPEIAGELHGLALYGWIFSVYLLAQIVGTVVAGQLVDRHGPAVPAAAALLTFGAGLLLAALAPTMTALIGARALQGLGAGGLANCAYASITLRYDDRLRPSMLAIVSSAYVIPSMIGPFLAALLAERFSWRAVFWVLLPILVTSAALTLPAYRGTSAAPASSAGNRLQLALALAIGTGILLAGLGHLPGVVGVLLAVGGLTLALVALRRLAPSGTLVARHGVPAAIAARGLFVAAYFAADTYLVLTLTALHGASTSAAGLVIASGSLVWTACAWLQARLDARDSGRGRAGRIRLGVTALLLGAIGMATVPWLGHDALAVGLAAHFLAGMGIGLAHPSVGAFAFARAGVGEAGGASAAILLADAFTPAVAIGVGGAIIGVGAVLGWPEGYTIAAALTLSVPLLVLALFAALRLEGWGGEA